MKNKGLLKMSIAMVVLAIIATVICFFINLYSGIVCLILSVLMFVVFVFYTKQRYKEIGELSDYLFKICNNNDAFDISDNEEGELSVLKNNIRKTSLKLRTQSQLLTKDKLYLADSLADISHQLKTPITSMMVMTDLLSDENLSPQKRKEFLRNISNQLDKMQWLIITLLKISKFDAGTVVLKEEKIDITDIVATSIEPFLLQMELKNINYVSNISKSLFLGDFSWTNEATENIIKNCIEHMKIGDTLTIETNDNPLYSEMIIEDTGCGIEKEDLPHIFERFYKGKHSSSESVGIGLALSKSIFNRESATVDVKSDVGVGTRFTIRFYKTVI